MNKDRLLLLLILVLPLVELLPVVNSTGIRVACMGAKSHPPSQPSSAASVHCMHIHIFNKVYYLLQVLYSENGLTWKYVKVGSEVKLFEGNPLYNHAIAHSTTEGKGKKQSINSHT